MITLGATLTVAVSELALAMVPPGTPSRVIWNAVDPDRLVARRSREVVRRDWGVPPGVKVAGYLGRLAEEKNPEVLVDLAAVLSPGWVIVAVGDGAMRSVLLGVPRMIVVGADPVVGDVLGAFDCLLSSSHHESFGLSVAEAFAARVPVIATPTGLPALRPDLVRMVPMAPSGPDLALAIAADEADPVGTRDRIDRAKVFAAERLSLGRFGREWTELLTSIAHPKGRP